jgi:hypothetical protein
VYLRRDGGCMGKGMKRVKMTWSKPTTHTDTSAASLLPPREGEEPALLVLPDIS